MKSNRKHQAERFDLLGTFIKHSCAFPGKSRIVKVWLNKVKQSGHSRLRTLPGSGKVSCDLSIPYEAMVWLGWEEQTDLETLTHLLHPGDVFIDCGANIGLWSIVAASAVGAEGNPVTAKKLQQNVTRGSWSQISVAAKAVGNTNAEIFFHCETAHNNSSVAADQTDSTITVPVITLDTFSTGSVSGCKIDVEGFEMNVLEGAEKLLVRDCPWICIEFNTLIAQTHTLGEWNVHQYLRGLGYNARRFEDALSSSAETILSSEWETQKYCNLFYCVGH